MHTNHTNQTDLRKWETFSDLYRTIFCIATLRDLLFFPRILRIPYTRSYVRLCFAENSFTAFSRQRKKLPIDIHLRVHFKKQLYNMVVSRRLVVTVTIKISTRINIMVRNLHIKYYKQSFHCRHRVQATKGRNVCSTLMINLILNKVNLH